MRQICMLDKMNPIFLFFQHKQWKLTKQTCLSTLFLIRLRTSTSSMELEEWSQIKTPPRIPAKNLSYYRSTTFVRPNTNQRHIYHPQFYSNTTIMQASFNTTSPMNNGGFLQMEFQLVSQWVNKAQKQPESKLNQRCNSCSFLTRAFVHEKG